MANSGPYLIACLGTLVFIAYLRIRASNSSRAGMETINDNLYEHLFSQVRAANEDRSRHHSLILPDGRVLGFATYGSTQSAAPTVFFIHGGGDNRLSGAFFHAAAENSNIRLISVDRPGNGLSSTHLEGTVLTFARDLEYLTEQIGVRRYAIIGASGGGPFTLACAYALPADQLQSLTMFIAAGPFASTVMRHSKWAQWLFWSMIKNSAVLRRLTARQAISKYRSMNREEYAASHKKQMSSWWVRMLSRQHEKDRAVFQDDAMVNYSYDLLKENAERADGVEGLVQDWKIMTTEDLGFELEDIRSDLPVQLWYGVYDESVSWRVGRDLKKRMQGEKVELHLREETHLSMWVNCGSEVLEMAMVGWRA